MIRDVDAGPATYRDRRRPASEPPSRALAAGTALASGMIAALLGTALHANTLFVAGFPVPLGAFAALLLAGSSSLWVGLWAGSVLAAGLAAATSYVVVALLSMSVETLILTGTGTVSGPMLPASVAGNMWVFGLAGVALLSVFLCSRFLRPAATAGPR